jgi:hypothetical protein
MEITTPKDLIKALREIGYSDRATKAISKWYT